MAEDGSGGGFISVLQNGVKALNNVAVTIGKVFPAASGTATSATAGSDIAGESRGFHRSNPPQRNISKGAVLQ